MFSDKRRVPRLAGTVVAVLFATTALLATAVTAQAAIELSDEFGTPITDQMVFDGQEIQVHGSELPEGAEGATHVAIALCDIDGATTQEELGTRCDNDTGYAVGFTPLALYLEGAAPGPEPTMLVKDIFDNWDFSHNDDGVGTTECAGTEGDEDCAVLVSFYSFTPAPFHHYAEAQEVTFEAP